ncbi:MAG: hypothetical protein WA633_17710 [Stellaceae bacterium]
MSKLVRRAEASRSISLQLSRFARSALATIVVTAAVLGAGAQSVLAQEATGPGGMQIFVTPYLWLAGIHATIETPLERAPTVNANIGSFDLLGDLTGAPFMGSAEVRYGPIGLIGDVLHVPFSTNISTRNVFYQGGSVGITANTGTAVVLYRFLETPNQFADLGGGFRAWGFDANVELNPGLLAGVSRDQKAGWGDPLIAGRYHYDFGNGFAATAYGDLGGFGVGAHTDWQVMGTIDYALNSWINLHLGYRSLNFTFSSNIGSVGFNVHMRGPIFAGTFRF